jgi:hypothetical protein
VFNLIITCLIFAVLLPLSIPLCCIGLTLYYWFFKVRLLKVYREPPKLAANLIKDAGSYLPWVAYLGVVSLFLNAFCLDSYVQSDVGIKVKLTSS